MNRINRLFATKKSDILSIYFTAGYPSTEDTVEIITALEKCGADMVEIGIPFSDPVADGPVIQESNRQALQNGMSLTKLFGQLRDIRKKVSFPLVMMGYINPIYRMGMNNFLQQCAETGIDGVIIPDLPVEEYQKEYIDLFERYNIHFICLITPQSPVERIRFIDNISGGFIYMVSTSSTTGSKDSFDERQSEYFRRIQDMNLKTPILTGFGISNYQTFKAASRYTNGAIIGSAYIKALGEKSVDLRKKTELFISGLKKPL